MSFSERDIPDLAGKTAIVTGATGGLGYETARMLAEHGARVILAGRNQAKGSEALANIRATAYIFACATVCAILTPLMPSAELALAFMALASMFGLAGAPAQNSAIQRVAPNEMRGQVTALYLFMFIVFGATGSWVIGVVSTYVVGDPAQVWQALLIVAAGFMPVATFFMFRAIKPYREEVERLEALGR